MKWDTTVVRGRWETHNRHLSYVTAHMLRNIHYAAYNLNYTQLNYGVTTTERTKLCERLIELTRCSWHDSEQSCRRYKWRWAAKPHSGNLTEPFSDTPTVTLLLCLSVKRTFVFTSSTTSDQGQWDLWSLWNDDCEEKNLQIYIKIMTWTVISQIFWGKILLWRFKNIKMNF